jgi:hypothetical protein
MLIALAFVLLNAGGYGLKRYFFPERLKFDVLEEFIFSIKAGDLEHAMEFLSPDLTVVVNAAGEKIGLASGQYFWSFSELALCAMSDSDERGFILENGGIVTVRNRWSLSMHPGGRVFPWNRRSYLDAGDPEKTAVVLGYLGDALQDDTRWKFGVNELERITGRVLCARKPPSRNDRQRILNEFQTRGER